MANFKYHELAAQLSAQITSGQYQSGDQLPTEQELSRQTGLSRDTVRKAIALLESRDLIYKVKGSGTYVQSPAGQLKPDPNASKRIGIMMNDVDSYIFPSIVKGISRVLEHEGYTGEIQITFNQISKERAVLEAFLNGDYAGLIIEPTKAALPQVNYNLYQKLSRTKPTVLIHGKIPTLPLSAITMGDEQGAFKLTSYLLDAGHRDISIFCKHDEQTGTARYLGFVKAFQSAGLPIPDDNIFWLASEHIPDFFSDELTKTVARKLKSSSAVICHDDRLALALDRYLDSQAELDTKPVICGFDDTEIAKDHHFISVAHPKQKFGEYTALKLLEKIKNPSLDVSYDFNPQLSLNGCVISR